MLMAKAEPKIKDGAFNDQSLLLSHMLCFYLFTVNVDSVRIMQTKGYGLRGITESFKTLSQWDFSFNWCTEQSKPS